MTRIWRKLLLAATVALPGAVVANISAASAAPATVYVFNTDLASNTGLAFCDGVSAKGCIDSVVIDGQALTPDTSSYSKLHSRWWLVWSAMSVC